MLALLFDQLVDKFLILDISVLFEKVDYALVSGLWHNLSRLPYLVLLVVIVVSLLICNYLLGIYFSKKLLVKEVPLLFLYDFLLFFSSFPALLEKPPEA